MLLSSLLKNINAPYRLVRDGEFSVLEQCTNVRKPNAITYIESPKYVDCLNNEYITCVICSDSIADLIPETVVGIVSTPCPKFVFFKLNEYCSSLRDRTESRISDTAIIDTTAVIADHDVIIGNNVIIGAHTVINAHTTIRDNSIIGPGTIVGGQSFTVIRDNSDNLYVTKDTGSVVIEENVEICSNCHIACGTLENDVTLLHKQAKLDAMVHIGHGTQIGERTLITSGAHIAGNCVIGNDVWVGVHATVSNRIIIGDNCRISLGSVVTKNVQDGKTVTGNFAIDHNKFIENLKANR